METETASACHTKSSEAASSEPLLAVSAALELLEGGSRPSLLSS